MLRLALLTLALALCAAVPAAAIVKLPAIPRPVEGNPADRMLSIPIEDSDAAVPADLIRLSCGIEDAADLVEDLARAIGAPVPATA